MKHSGREDHRGRKLLSKNAKKRKNKGGGQREKRKRRATELVPDGTEHYVNDI